MHSPVQLATVEWDLLLEAVFGMTGPMIRLTRLLKVLRLARMGRLIARLTARQAALLRPLVVGRALLTAHTQ